MVLKIRRRKFNRTPQKGEMVVTRRLFRTGDSEYLLNGKLCRLRDIQDIFMGTGLGPESYAIIGQERIGQLLSSRPHDRRAIIEEAAGITRFKTKKRLAELRLEQAKQNLARVNDIFEEVTRQMASLKRQAAKAERYGKLRDEMRAKLKVVLASRIAQMDTRQAELEAEIASLTEKIDAGAERVNGLEAEHTALMERGYLLEDAAKDAETRANQRAVEIERADARHQTNQERIAELDVRMAAAQAELEQAAEHVRSMTAERDAQRSFLETAAAGGGGVPRAGAAEAGSDADGGDGGFRGGAAVGDGAAAGGAAALAGRQRAQPDHAGRGGAGVAGARGGAAGRRRWSRRGGTWRLWEPSAGRCR